MFEDVSDPERDSVTKKPWWWWAPVDADEAKRDIFLGCGFLFLFLGIDLWTDGTRFGQVRISLYVAALVLIAALALTRSPMLALLLAADTAVIAWMGEIPQLNGHRHPFVYFALPFVSLFWLGTRCSAYHRFRAEEAKPGAGRGAIDPGTVDPG